jgi:hypothetical protein
MLCSGVGSHVWYSPQLAITDYSEQTRKFALQAYIFVKSFTRQKVISLKKLFRCDLYSDINGEILLQRMTL